MKILHFMLLLLVLPFKGYSASEISRTSNGYIKAQPFFYTLRTSVLSAAFISERERTEFNISPNPATSILTVSCNKSVQPYSLSIYDLLGKKVKGIVKMVNNKIEIDISDLQNGIYFLQIENKQEIIQQEKIVIAH